MKYKEKLHLVNSLVEIENVLSFHGLYIFLFIGAECKQGESFEENGTRKNLNS